MSQSSNKRLSEIYLLDFLKQNKTKLMTCIFLHLFLLLLLVLPLPLILYLLSFFLLITEVSCLLRKDVFNCLS